MVVLHAKTNVSVTSSLLWSSVCCSPLPSSPSWFSSPLPPAAEVTWPHSYASYLLRWVTNAWNSSETYIQSSQPFSCLVIIIEHDGCRQLWYIIHKTARKNYNCFSWNSENTSPSVIIFPVSLGWTSCFRLLRFPPSSSFSTFSVHLNTCTQYYLNRRRNCLELY